MSTFKVLDINFTIATSCTRLRVNWTTLKEVSISNGWVINQSVNLQLTCIRSWEVHQDEECSIVPGTLIVVSDRRVRVRRSLLCLRVSILLNVTRCREHVCFVILECTVHDDRSAPVEQSSCVSWVISVNNLITGRQVT